MTEKAKKHKYSLLTALCLAVVLVLSGIGVLGAGSVTASGGQPSASSAVSSATGTDEVTSESASPVVTTWTTAGQYTYQALPGKYKLEVWGGKGGDDHGETNTSTNALYDRMAGGNGGYTYATFTTTETLTLYVVVGGNGRAFSDAAISGYQFPTMAPVLNGGGVQSGVMTNGSIYKYGGSGGGATHIALSSGELSTFSGKQNDVLVVAGGGGGCGHHTTPNGAVNGLGGGGNNNGTDGHGGCGTPGKGGTTTAGGAATSSPYANLPAGTFGKGADQATDVTVRSTHMGGGAGGGGWYGGSAAAIDTSLNDDGGGGGGSGHIAATPTKGTISDGNGTVGTSTSSKATITPLNVVPVQNGEPTIALDRTTAVTIPLEGTSASQSLLLDDPDANERVQIRTTGIFMSASASGVNASAAGSADGYWLDYTANADATSITLKAKRWWSGTKRFYLNVTDYNSVYASSPGANVWVSFLATCATGSPLIQSGPTNLGTGGVSDNTKYNYGNTGFTQVAKNAQPLSAAAPNTLFNPTGSGRPTLWLAESVKSDTTVSINVTDLYLSTRNAEEVIAFTGSPAYGATKYENSRTSTAAAVGTAITGGAGNSSYVSTASYTNPVNLNYYNGTAATPNYTRGYGTLNLVAKRGVPAGDNYYVITVTLVNLDRSAGGAINSTWTVDVIYRVENTRPNLVSTGTTEPAKTVKSGSSTSIALSEICTDPDGNDLTIADVIVPSGEFVLVTKYGAPRKLPTGTNYNYGINNSLSDDYTLNGYGYTGSVTNAQLSSVSTGFSPEFIYHDTSAAAADRNFTPTQSANNTEGNSNSAYIGYYVNTARSTLYIIGNKASRKSYANDTEPSTRKLDFYILVRVVDSGDPLDDGIWFPVAIAVTSSEPVALNATSSVVTTGVPTVVGNAGDTFYFSPLSGKDNAGNIFAIGAYAEDERGTNLANDTLEKNGNGVLPFAYDPDNYSWLTTNSASRRFNGTVMESCNGSEASYAQREGIFLTSSDYNTQIFRTLAESNADIESVTQGFKEFFTVEPVTLYARTSVLLGLPDSEIAKYMTSGAIRADSDMSPSYFAFTGIKITLRKHTMSKYLSFSLDVADTHDSQLRVRFAVSVNNTPLTSTTGVRGGTPFERTDDYNTRGGITERMYDDEIVIISDGSGNTTEHFESAIFKYSAPINTEIRISAYDLFYNNDTYKVNTLNADGSVRAYNSMAEDNVTHNALMKGLNKSIAVLAADSPSATPTEYPYRNASGETVTFGFKKIYISNTTPNYAGASYGKVKHVPEVPGRVAEHFLITTSRKTPSSGYISFNFIVESTAGDSAVAEVRIYVLNSLPVVRTTPNRLPSVFYLSAAPKYSKLPEDMTAEEYNAYFENGADIFENSSMLEQNKGGFFEINGKTYNVREFTLADLFIDVDSDNVIFYDEHPVVRVGTMDNSGICNAEHFIEFLPGENIFLSATVGRGSNYRADYDDCVILEGLSSTQGVPAGVWICLKVKDDAFGTTEYREFCFQVEVLNTVPETAEMTGDNAMETVVNGDVTTYLWKGESDTERSLYPDVRTPQGAQLNQNGAYPQKPFYVASDSSAMEAYKNMVRTGYTDTDRSGNPLPDPIMRASFTYSSSQVRYIAQDKDAGQGLVLASSLYTDPEQAASLDVQGFDVIADGSTWAQSNAAVSITACYGANVNTQYYRDNRVVQLFFYETGADGKLTRTVDPAVTHVTTHWVVVFTFPTDPGTVDIKLRLRDSNEVIPMRDEIQEVRQGGYSNTAFRGVRDFDAESGRYIYANNYRVSSAAVFGFTRRFQTKGLFNNLSRWSTDEVVDDISVKNVWTVTEKETGDILYYHQQTEFADEFTGGVTNDSLFRYDGVRVGADREVSTDSEGNKIYGDYIGVTVPLSYFAFSANNADNPLRGASQTDVAWFDIAESNITATRGTDGAVFALKTPGSLNAQEQQELLQSYIFEAITLFDGYNRWSGSTLNMNPYIDFEYVSGEANFTSSPYFSQQRFLLSADGVPTKIPAEATVDGYFFEDVNGLRLTKKNVRTVGTNLSMTVNMAPWHHGYANTGDAFRIDYGSEYYGAGGAVNEEKKEDKTIVVSVPLKVDNTIMRLSGNSAAITMTSDVGGRTIELNDKTGTASNPNIIEFFTKDDVDRHGVTIGDLRVSYVEDMYFLSSSITGSFSATDLAYIKQSVGGDNPLLDDDMKSRLVEYFGVSSADEIFNGDALSSAVKINNGYNNYFTVTPSGVDGKTFTILPKRLTTFAMPETTTKTEFEQQLRRRGLKAKYTTVASDDSVENINTSTDVEYLYYPFKVIVYDRIAIGFSNNCTKFDESSFDVITINVTIENSAPTVQISTFNQYIQKDGNGVQYDSLGRPLANTYIEEGGKPIMGRVIELTKNGRPTVYKFTDIIQDADMVLSPSRNYYTQEEIGELQAENENGLNYNVNAAIIKDTADYLHKIAANGTDLVRVQFLPLNRPDGDLSTGVTNEYNPADGTGAIACAVGVDNVEINVVNRTSVSEGGLAAKIKLTFEDSHGEQVSAIIAVSIINSAPQLTEEATNTSRITMKTGQYFTLYTTPWDMFAEGNNGISATVGENFDGTYFEAVSGNASNISKNLPQYYSWEYGPGMPNAAINGTYVDNEYEQHLKNKRNIGFMAIAKDDAAWTLRISKVTVGASNSEISYTLLNPVLYEGSRGGNNQVSDATAVMFEALGACTDITISVQVSDGHRSLDSNPLSITYNFKVTVVSTPPEAITAIAQDAGICRLGKSLMDTQYDGRLKHARAEQTETDYVYDLRMYVGESITMYTSDFATDADDGDEEIMYLLSLNGNSPFTIANPNVSSQWLTISHRSGSNKTTYSTQFTVTALNFQNGFANSEDMYTEVQFYISDPHYSDVANSVLIRLRIYVYPHKVKAATNARTVEVKSYAEYSADNERPQSVNLVGKPGSGSIFEDNDAEATRTRYSVNVYTYLKYNNAEMTEVGAYTAEEFANLESSAKSYQLVASFNAQTSAATSFATLNSRIISNYIENITFSDNGSIMYISPRHATNGVKYLVGREGTGITFAVEVEKYVERIGATSGDDGPLYPDDDGAPSMSAQTLLHTSVRNSAPVAVGNTSGNFNARGDAHPYLSVDGNRGSQWNFYIYNPWSDEALFTDHDGDVISYYDGIISDVYTLDASGSEKASHIDIPGVRAAAERALRINGDLELTYNRGGESISLPAMSLEVLNKISIYGQEGRIVYVDITVYGCDGDESRLAGTVITVGIINSTPTFKETDEISDIYNSVISLNSYEKDGQNASLTLTLGKDPDENIITGTAGSTARVSLFDLLRDDDYTGNSDNIESFSFVAPLAAAQRPDLSGISGDTSAVLWLDGGDFGVARSDAELAEVGDSRFKVSVENAQNTVLVFTVDSYERDATDSFLLIVMDSSGARTGTLTVTLKVANSAPIDKTLTGATNRNIILAGGKEGTGGNNTFEPVEYSIFNYVDDHNPSDHDPVTEAPTEARTYMRLVNYSIRSITFDDASDYSDFLDKEAENDVEPPYLVNFIMYEQSFTIAPIAKLYGRQVLELMISDAGNTDELSHPGSKTIYVTLEIQITKNPDDMPTYEYSLYWMRTMRVTARDIFDDPSTPDHDESEGLLLVGIDVHNALKQIATAQGSGIDWTVSGVTRKETVGATASVIVGTEYSETAKVYMRDFDIKVLDNLKPQFALNSEGVSWGSAVTYIRQDSLDKKGRITIPITDILTDEAGDDLKVVSVSSTKSTLISVSSDGENLNFRFKSRGDTTVKVRVSDAVATYSYSFKVGNTDLPAPNFFVGVISKVQGNPTMYILIACGIIVLLIILVAIIAAIGKKKRMQEEIEAMLVSEMELEDCLSRLAEGSSSKEYYSRGYDYLPPPNMAGQMPAQGYMLGGSPVPPPGANGAIGLNPGEAPGADNGLQQLPPPDNFGGNG